MAGTRFLMFIFLVFSLNALGDTQIEFHTEIGNKSSTDTEFSHLDEFQTYLQPAFSLKEFDSWGEIEFKVKGKATLDTQGERFVPERGFVIELESENWKKELALRTLSISYSKNQLKTVVGFIEVPWGETFGFPILDIINPRDLRDPIFQDENQVRIPVLLIDQRAYFQNTTLQLVFTPFPRHPILPNPGSKYDPSLGLSEDFTSSVGRLSYTRDFELSPNWNLNQSEFGGKLSHLFENGLDLGLIAYRHKNRNLIYSTRVLGPTDFEIYPYEQSVFTLGASATLGLDQWVVRTDQAYHISQPLQLQEPLEVDRLGQQWQGALGVDFNANDFGTYGIQVQGQAQLFSETSQEGKTLFASGFRASKHFFSDQLELEIFSFLGIGNTDFWLQPKVTLQFLKRCSFSIRADFIKSSERPFESYLWALDGKHRFLSIFAVKL